MHSFIMQQVWQEANSWVYIARDALFPDKQDVSATRTFLSWIKQNMVDCSIPRMPRWSGSSVLCSGIHSLAISDVVRMNLHSFIQVYKTFTIVAKFTDEQYTTINQSTAGRFDPSVFVNCLLYCIRMYICIYPSNKDCNKEQFNKHKICLKKWVKAMDQGHLCNRLLGACTSFFLQCSEDT